MKLFGRVDSESIFHHSQRGAAEQSQSVVIDMNDVTFITPCGMATLAAFIEHLLSRNVGVKLNAQGAPCFTYMQNMNLFGLFNVYKSEQFNRHPSAGRFCRMGRVDRQLADTDKLAREMTDTIQVEGWARRELLHCLEESLSNLWSHAQSPGYAVAQSFKRGTSEAYYELAICDPGQGIRSSLSQNAEYTVLNDEDALRLACERGVGRFFNVANSGHFGMGLWGIDTVARTTGGMFSLCSGACIRHRIKDHVIYREMPYWRGTSVALKLDEAGIMECHQQMANRPAGSIRHD